MKVTIGISARHVHLTKEMYNKLFRDELTFKSALNQPGQFASNETVTIKTPKSSIENVRILGPLRSYNQVEISKTDAIKLGINPPVRRSGDVNNSPGITIISPTGEITLNEGVIIAERHVHIAKNEADKLGLKDKMPLEIVVPGTKGMYKDTLSEKAIAFLKVEEKSYYEMHIDTDDANAFLLQNGDEVDINL